jgi:hypothetical protein
VQRNSDLAARLVDPCADLGGLVDGDAGGYDNGRGDDDACGERAVRTGAFVGRGRARDGACKQVGKSSYGRCRATWLQLQCRREHCMKSYVRTFG